MVSAVLLPGDGERRSDARYELEAWASVCRANGERAGLVLVTDISRGGFNIQSRWDFAAREQFSIELATTAFNAKVAWHDPVVGAFGCRFAQVLTRDDFDKITAFSGDITSLAGAALSQGERRGASRPVMHVPVTARRAGAIEREVIVLTNLSASGFCMRSGQSYEVNQTVYVELAHGMLAEARVSRHDAAQGVYAARFTYSLPAVMIERLMASNLALRNERNRDQRAASKQL